MVPIGDKFTMGPFEAALASMWLNPKVVIPMHYNTFPPIEQDPLQCRIWHNRDTVETVL